MIMAVSYLVSQAKFHLIIPKKVELLNSTTYMLYLEFNNTGTMVAAFISRNQYWTIPIFPF